MHRLLTKILAVACLFFTGTYGQYDPLICPNGLTPTPVDPMWRPVPPRFEVIGELVSDSNIIEFSQAFSPLRDAVITTMPGGTPIQFYYNFATGELFQVLNFFANQQIVPQCFRELITTASQTSVITPNTRYVKPSILLGYDPTNQPNPTWSLRYDGNDFIRGIPANRFRACFYVNDIKATVSALYFVSDVTRFQAYLPANQSILLQVDVNITGIKEAKESYTYNFLRYSPNPSRREERLALETPTGVFCANRTQTLPVPSNIPESSRASGEISLPNFNASIISTKNIYDTNFLYTLFDVWFPDPLGGSEWQHLTEFHDFAVGLSYRFNHSDYHCRVENLTTNRTDAVVSPDNPNLITLGNPQHLFLLDDMSYHYTGEKKCQDQAWCHVWIGEKPMENGTTEHREWYWASRIRDEVLVNWIPTKLIIKRMVASIPINTVEINIFQFHRRDMGIFEIDRTLSDCYRALGPSRNYNLAVLSFKIINDQKYPVFQNINFLRFHIWETLIFTMFVRPIRISNLIVDKDDNDILVTFTLLDVPPTTGPVERPLEESNLDTVIDRFTSIIDSNGLAFRARYDNKQVILRARIGSLNVGHRSAVKKTKSSGSKVTGLWIGFVLIGIVVGVIGGVFLFNKMAK